jgi:hypothetical protein
MTSGSWDDAAEFLLFWLKIESNDGKVDGMGSWGLPSSIK